MEPRVWGRGRGKRPEATAVIQGALGTGEEISVAEGGISPWQFTVPPFFRAKLNQARRRSSEDVFSEEEEEEDEDEDDEEEVEEEAVESASLSALPWLSLRLRPEVEAFLLGTVLEGRRLGKPSPNSHQGNTGVDSNALRRWWLS